MSSLPTNYSKFAGFIFSWILITNFCGVVHPFWPHCDTWLNSSQPSNFISPCTCPPHMSNMIQPPTINFPSLSKYLKHPQTIHQQLNFFFIVTNLNIKLFFIDRKKLWIPHVQIFWSIQILMWNTTFTRTFNINRGFPTLDPNNLKINMDYNQIVKHLRWTSKPCSDSITRLEMLQEKS